MSKTSTASLPKPNPTPATASAAALPPTSTPTTTTTTTSIPPSQSTTTTTTTPSTSRPVSAWSKGPPLAARSSSASPAPNPLPPNPTLTTPATAAPTPTVSTHTASVNTNVPASASNPSAPPSGAVTPTSTTGAGGGGHGRKGSVAVKDGVSVGRGAGGTLGQKAGSGMSFGSISGPGSPRSPKPRSLSKPPSPAPALTAPTSAGGDVKAFGSVPAAAAASLPSKPSSDAATKPKDTAEPAKKPLKKKIDVNALFQAVPHPASSPSPSRTASTLPSTSATSPVPPSTPASTTASNAPVTGRQPNGAPTNIYNGVPMRNGPQPQQGQGQQQQQGGPQGQMPPQMMGSPVRFSVQAGRGGPPNGIGRGQQQGGPQQQQQQQGGPPQGPQGQQQQGPPGSPRPPPGPGMMSPLVQQMMMPPGVGPGSPWAPYYVPGLQYYDPSQQPGPHQQQGQPSPYPTYWQPGMPPPTQGMPPPGPPPPHLAGPHGQMQQGYPQQGPPQGMQGMMLHPGHQQAFPPHMQQHPGHHPQQQQQHSGQQQQHPGQQGAYPGQQQQGGLQVPPPPPGAQHPLSPPMRPQGMPPLPGSVGPQQQQHQQQQQQPGTASGTPLHLPSSLPHHPHLQPGPPGTPAPLTPQSARPGLPGLPPTPGTPSFRFPLPATPGLGASQLNTAAREFVPSAARGTTKIKLARPDGTPLDFSHMRTPSTVVSPVVALTPVSEKDTPSVAAAAVAGAKKEEPSPLVVGRKPSAPVRMESEADKAKREKEEEERARREKEDEERKEREKKEEEVRKVREEEERVRREKEEAERKVREEEERVKHEKEEKERKEKEEKERVEREKLIKEEMERERKLVVEREAAAAKAKAEEEAAVAAAAKVKAEEEARIVARKAEEHAIALKLLAEQTEREKAALAAAAAAAAAEKEQALEKEKEDTLSALPSALPSAANTPTSPSTPEMGATPLLTKPTLVGGIESAKTRRPVPGPLDLKSALAAAKAAPPLPSAQATALLSAKPIEDLLAIQYPAGIRTPDPDLNAPGKSAPGKFRYDRDFLMQFMNICKDKPETLPPLDAIGLEPGEGFSSAASGGRTPGGAARRAGLPPRAGTGLGITGPGTAFGGKPGFSMGNFQAPARSLGVDGAEGGRRAVSTFGIPGSATGAGGLQRPLPMQRTASASGLSASVTPGSPSSSGRNRSLRGKPRSESRQPSQMPAQQPMGPSFEPLPPLQPTANRWMPQAALGRGDRPPQDSPEVVERKVKALLNKLTLERFDSISDQIISYANRSEHESDGHTLILVIKLVFEKATDEPAWSEMYARLCRKMMERISPNVHDVQVKNAEDQLIVGGQLFRKYLLNRCQEDFERGWAHRRQLAEAGTGNGAAPEAGEEIIFSEAYYETQKAKRRGLGLVKLIGELFKLQMLTERIMHECIKKMLANVETPEEEEIESLCKLLSTVGQALDTVKAKAHMDIYFARMKEMAHNPKVASRMRYMLVEIIELRERGWRDRKEKGPQGPMTIAQVHQAAIHEQQKEAARSAHNASMSRGGSRRGDVRGDFNVGPDGWQNVQGGPPPRPPPPAKVGDLSHFGKINKTTGPITNFGPSTAFAKKDAGKAGARNEPAPAPARTGNMFNLLGSGAEAGAEVEGPPVVKGPSRKPSVDLGPGGAPSVTDAGSQRKKLKLLPRSVPLPDESGPPSAVESTTEPELPTMSDEQAQAKIDEDVKEFWQVRDVAEAATYFQDLPTTQHEKLIDRFVSEVFNKKEADVALVADVFSRAVAAEVVSAEAFKKGLAPTVEFLDDVAVDVPQAYAFMAKLMKGAQLSQADAEDLAGKISVEGDPLVQPKDKLLKELSKLA